MRGRGGGKKSSRSRLTRSLNGRCCSAAASLDAQLEDEMCWRGGRKRIRAREASSVRPRVASRGTSAGRARSLFCLASGRASNPGGRTDDVPSRSSASPPPLSFRIPDIFLLAIKTHCMMVCLDKETKLVVRSFALPDLPWLKGHVTPTSSSLHILHACQPRVRCIHCDGVGMLASHCDGR